MSHQERQSLITRLAAQLRPLAIQQDARLEAMTDKRPAPRREPSPAMRLQMPSAKLREML